MKIGFLFLFFVLPIKISKIFIFHHYLHFFMKK
jgi:hypothetical protein